MHIRLTTPTGNTALAIDRDWLAGIVNALYASHVPAPVSSYAAARMVQIAHQLGDAAAIDAVCAATDAYHPHSRASAAAEIARLAVTGGSSYDAARVLDLPRDAAYLWLSTEGLDDLWPQLLANDPATPPPLLPADRRAKVAAAVARPKNPADARTPTQKLIDHVASLYNGGADLQQICARTGVSRYKLLPLLRSHDKEHLAHQLVEEERDG